MGLWWAGFPPTPEQQCANDVFEARDDLVIEAGAGKTSTLRRMGTITPEQRAALLGELKVRYPKDRRRSYSYLFTGGVAVCGICDTALVARP